MEITFRSNKRVRMILAAVHLPLDGKRRRRYLETDEGEWIRTSRIQSFIQYDFRKNSDHARDIGGTVE
jgi:hypothetical protein